MEQYRTNKTRLDMTVAELTALLEKGEHPGTVANMFIETTTPDTFASLYQELPPSLRDYVVSVAKTNAANFDECIAWARKKGLYADGWVAYRAWAHAQPWFPEALATAEHFKALRGTYEEEIAREIARLEAMIPTAKNDVELGDILGAVEDRRREIARWQAENDD